MSKTMYMAGNTPKATYNVLKIFNNLSGDWVEVSGGDDDVSAVAAWDAKKGRLAVVLVNFRFQYAMPRKVELAISRLPESLREGRWREERVMGTDKVLVLTIAPEDKAMQLAEDIAPILTSHGLLFSMWDVQVIRGERF